MGLDSKKTAVVFLGSATFPKSNFTDSEAFSMAKTRIEAYFQKKLDVPNDLCLDLFNSDKSADEQDNSIDLFIKDKVKSGAEDIFIYYVGHGGFSPTDETFYLAITGTRDASPAVSSMTIRTLANTIIRSANGVRVFIILDCCFAAAAGTSFMSSEAVAPAIQIKEAFASKGVALLCASSKDLPALIVEERKITMFTESFNEALVTGDSSITNKYLSLRQIHKLTTSFINKLNSQSAVRPELHSPVQMEGDIADLPTFENFAFSDSKYDIVAKKREIEGEMIKNNLKKLGSLFIDFVRNFDEREMYNIESILLCSESSELSDEKGVMERAEFRVRKEELYRQIMSIIEKIIKQNIESKAA